MKLLIVDDNEMSLEMTAELARALEFDVLTAESGEMALQIVGETIKTKDKPDAILMDYRMPGMDGAEAAKCIRELEQQTGENGRITIIGMSGDTDENTNSILLSAGMDDVMGKPVEMAKLMSLAAGESINSQLSDANDVQEADVLSQETVVLPKEVTLYDGSVGIKYAGNVENYYRFLENFANLYIKKRDIILNAFSEDDIRLFTVEVHALKSNARSLGNDKLSKLSAKLEELGDAENKIEIEKLLPEFRDLFEASYTEAKLIVEKHNLEVASESELIAFDKKHVVELLETLGDAVDSFDLDTADFCSEDIKKINIPEEYKDMISEILIDLADVDFMAVREKVNRLIKEIKG